MGLNRLVLAASLVFVAGCVTQPLQQFGNDSLLEQRKLAARFYQKKDYRDALPVYERLVEEIPDDALLHFRLGNLYAHLKQPDRAVAAYRRAVQLNPRMDKAWYNMSVVQLRQAANSLTQMLHYTDPKRPLYQRAMRLSESVVDLLEGRGDATTKR